MFGIIIMGHGHFATGIQSSLELIMGKTDDLIAIDFPEESNKEILSVQLDQAIASFQSQDHILIMTDLFGGSPFNVAMERALSNEKIRLLYGTNLAMLMELVVQRNYHDENDLIHEAIVEVGKKQVGYFNPAEFVSYEDEDDEDSL